MDISKGDDIDHHNTSHFHHGVGPPLFSPTANVVVNQSCIGIAIATTSANSALESKFAASLESGE